ncbi:MAG: Methionine aminopeptidase [Parcubacteria group bacterium GW2011_GWC2_42_6]|nr:MAG: Methionine aminopeptidase [Parcubacteria group bacterium GW2011_GWA2_42_11]KKS68446.1 MAG: Methionine aminopeptidase [Parcubacteria group bacterium GW2011_GWC2_42_6]
MRQGGEILAAVLAELAKNIKPGITTAFLDELAEQLIYEKGALPGFKGFDGYPATLCTSINEEIVHALPSERKMQAGDIISLDLGVLYPPEQCGACPMAGGCGGQRGLYTDAAITVAVGEISEEAKNLIVATRAALESAVRIIKPGQKLSKVSEAIQRKAEQAGFAVIRDLVGHGVGYELHEDPQIPNFIDRNFRDVVLQEGMVLAIEPMLSLGSHAIKKSSDGFGFRTKDKSLAAHFEHTVAVTKNGGEVLTRI